MDDISEEDMKKLDDALANVFKQLSGKSSRKEKKKQERDAMANMHFKIRALDLVDVYLTRTPKVSHIVSIMVTVVNALESAVKDKAQKPFETRLRNTLKKLTNLKKPQQFKLDEGLDKNTLSESLKHMVEIASRASSVMPVLNNPIPLFSQSCHLLLKFSQLVDDSKLTQDMEVIFADALQDFFFKT